MPMVAGGMFLWLSILLTIFHTGGAKEAISCSSLGVRPILASTRYQMRSAWAAWDLARWIPSDSTTSSDSRIPAVSMSRHRRPPSSHVSST